ncbi:MAG: polysaccharide biosynthesis/export family protein [Flavisolibacter sp.]
MSDTVIRDAMTTRQSIIQKGDLLSIKVFSEANGMSQADIPYNLPEQTAAGAISGFLVDSDGNIEYPQLGKIKVEGLTKDELANVMKKSLEMELSRPSVIVRFLNYRITVLGEVGVPSTFTLQTDRITILEALGLAGDISEYGKKDNVKIIRENNGQVEIGTIDLTSKAMFASPYFKLQQNDVVYVEQSRKKIQQQEQQVLAQQIGIATSIITAIALILNIIR